MNRLSARGTYLLLVPQGKALIRSSGPNSYFYRNTKMCETNRWCLFENDLEDWETDALSLGPYSLERPAKELLEKHCYQWTECGNYWNWSAYARWALLRIGAFMTKTNSRGALSGAEALNRTRARSRIITVVYDWCPFFDYCWNSDVAVVIRQLAWQRYQPTNFYIWLESNHLSRVGRRDAQQDKMSGHFGLSVVELKLSYICPC